jgi:hypothetical protein
MFLYTHRTFLEMFCQLQPLSRRTYIKSYRLAKTAHDYNHILNISWQLGNPFGGECGPLGRCNYLSEKLQYKAIGDKLYYTMTPPPPKVSEYTYATNATSFYAFFAQYTWRECKQGWSCWFTSFCWEPMNEFWWNLLYPYLLCQWRFQQTHTFQINAISNNTTAAQPVRWKRHTHH